MIKLYFDIINSFLGCQAISWANRKWHRCKSFDIDDFLGIDSTYFFLKRAYSKATKEILQSDSGILIGSGVGVHSQKSPGLFGTKSLIQERFPQKCILHHLHEGLNWMAQGEWLIDWLLWGPNPYNAHGTAVTSPTVKKGYWTR